MWRQPHGMLLPESKHDRFVGHAPILDEPHQGLTLGRRSRKRGLALWCARLGAATISP